MLVAGKVVLPKMPNRECIASNAEFRPQRTSLRAKVIQAARIRPTFPPVAAHNKFN